jgi:hemerythrin
MGLIEWSAALETGDARIDEQHRTLVKAFNDLEDALARRRGREAASRTLLFLVGYTTEHFRMEEELMDDAGFPDAGRHKRFHHDLVVKLSALLTSYTQGSATLNPDVMGFLEGWLVEHILGEDLRLAEFLRAH